MWIENIEFVKNSRPACLPSGIFYDWVQENPQVYFDSQGEARCAIFFTLCGFKNKNSSLNGIGFQHEFRDDTNYSRIFYVADYVLCYFYKEKEKEKEKTYKIFTDYKEKFTIKDFFNAEKVLVQENRLLARNPVWCERVTNKLLYVTNVFSDFVKDDEIVNVISGYPDFQKMKKRFLELFEKIHNISIKSQTIIKEIKKIGIDAFEEVPDSTKKMYAWNFDVFGGNPRKSVFFATDGFTPFLLNFEKYKEGGYNEFFLDKLVLPTLSAYWNVLRIQFEENPFGFYKSKYHGDKEFWLPRNELRQFKLQKQKNNQGEIKYNNFQQQHFECMTTIETQNVINEIISLKERLENATN